MGSDHRSSVIPSAHLFSNFKVGHLIESKFIVINEETSSELISNSEGDDRAPKNSKYNVEGDFEGHNSSQFIVSRQVVESSSTSGSCAGDCA